VAHGLASAPRTANETWFHSDLAEMSEDRLHLGHRRLRAAILLSDWLPAWAHERLGRIESELEARRAQ